MSDKTFYVTTPIYYVNARPHIGHAYTTIVADVLARRHRLLGEDTFFLTGTDEHGQKIERSAAAAGIPPQQFADQVSKSFEDLWKRMGITNNDYIRTTSDKHKQGVQHLFSELYARGFIYLASYTGSYCVSDEAFVDAPVGTPCPDCGRLLEEVTEENFFFKLSEFQQPLIDLIESGQLSITPDSRKNEVLSFVKGNVNTVYNKALINEIREEVLSKEERELEPEDGDDEDVAASPDDSHIWDELTRNGKLDKSTAGTYYVPGALKDLSVSRSSFTWGIPVPEPAASAAEEKHVIYVWLDALANYMTAIGYGSDDPDQQKKFEHYWPADLHLVGKEIIRFHCVYWPAFLLALNPGYHNETEDKGIVDVIEAAESPLHIRKSKTDPRDLTAEQHSAWAKKFLPKKVSAHGWLLFDNSKMSKSKGNIVRTETILDAFGTLCPPPPSTEESNRRGSASAVPGSTSTEDGASAPEVRLATQADRDLFASDVLRYFLLREIPFGQDGSFSFDALITRYNADLANGYGNLVSRTLSLIAKTSSGVIEDCPEANSLVFYQAPRIETPSQPERQEILSASECQLLGWGMTEVVEAFAKNIERNAFSEALTSVARAIASVDGLLTSRKPWSATDTELSQNGRRSTLYTAAESIRIITALLYPILPYATAAVWAQLGLGDIELAAHNGELTNLEWGGLKPGTKLGPLGPIFPRADKGLAQIMTDMENPTPVDTSTTDPAAAPRTSSFPELAAALPVGGSTALTTGPDPSKPAPEPSAAPAPEATPQITIDDFAKIELRVAQILVAERIPKADKLLRLEVDLGPFGKRQILSGIAEWYAPEDLISRRIVVITNLAPRKMRGLESHGMLLAASHGENGKPVLATFGEDIALGSRLK
jgi:methionyl-tRNA synthetase